MKFGNIALLSLLIALVCSISRTCAQDAAAGPKRIALRRPIVGNTAKTTTTAAPPPPAYDDEGDYPEENPDGENGEELAATSSTTTTTTEAPKKIGPVIRPFRSNDDFLNSLKRRQMNAKKHHAEKPTPKSRPPTGSENGDQAEESAPAPVAPSKGFKAGSSALNRRKPLKPAAVEDTAAEESEQQQKEETKLKRPQPSRLALRKRI